MEFPVSVSYAVLYSFHKIQKLSYVRLCACTFYALEVWHGGALAHCMTLSNFQANRCVSFSFSCQRNTLFFPYSGVEEYFDSKVHILPRRAKKECIIRQTCASSVKECFVFLFDCFAASDNNTTTRLRSVLHCHFTIILLLQSRFPSL